MRDGRRPIIAVVDDDEAVRESLRFLLEVAGYGVVTFASAGEFLGALGRQPPACVLVDQHMPELTGLELVRRLREAGHALPVALMTGSPSTALIRQASDLDVAVVLEKPLAEGPLFRFVERLDI